MAVFQLQKEIVFPHPSLAEKDGLLAIGGDLSIERLILAYTYGIFPWYNPGDPVLWWSPDPRCVLFPEKFKVSKSLKKIISKNFFKVKFDNKFREVIINCSCVNRKGQKGTWITNDMIEAYYNLYESGFAHSVEVYIEDNLVGGLYGVSIGKVFFGESMFSKVPNASKVALYFLVEKLKTQKYNIIDVQQTTLHLLSLGAEEICREEFQKILKNSITKQGNLLSEHSETI